MTKDEAKKMIEILAGYGEMEPKDVSTIIDMIEDDTVKQIISPNKILTWESTDFGIPEACKNCNNHPSNGGSGICFCTLGIPKIT